ncbi:MAG: 1-(5-phosphoribosyl)-5-[(5-phosphoribosylamino)methylideneamino]imidazole-4-carboxamide isomerase [Anaerolineales bacterium]
MIIYPAIDIKDGHVVRLVEGDPQRTTRYNPDPVAVAREWASQGAAWIHIVNLDGAFSTKADILPIVTQIVAMGLSVQLGGGLRSAEAVALALEAGAERVILGTAAVNNPEFAAEMVMQHGRERIVVALDAKDGKVMTHGWQQSSAWHAHDLGRKMADYGVQHVLYTDISRDGKLGGVNVNATQALAEATGLAVIASGGVRSLQDVRALLSTGAIAGAILGKALYEGLIDLPQALKLADSSA